MSAIFVHLSDIHFGQERDDSLHTHNDVKNELIADASRVVKDLPNGAALGILVTGDVAYSGKKAQYDDAALWLDRLAAAVGCEKFRIQMVPGNHDLDRDLLTVAGKWMLEKIRDGGAVEYEQILSNELDRQILFARFKAYGDFCEGYDCLLDNEGRYAANMVVELAPGRSIKFIRMNSSLLCHGNESDEEPELLVGARQFTIPRTEGEEIVALIHHPINWFKDKEDVSNYLRSRVRVLMSGHEHNPKVAIEKIEDGADFMTLAAGATVPSKSEEAYVFTYNIIEFDWDADRDALKVTMHPRVWNPVLTRFESDPDRLGGAQALHLLECPNFRAGASKKVQNTTVSQAVVTAADHGPVVEMVAQPESIEEGLPVSPEAPGYRLELLRFFRDLTEGERLRILISLNAISTESDERMTQAIERRLFDWLVRQGKLDNLRALIDEYISKKNQGGTV